VQRHHQISPADDDALKHIERAWGIRLNKETNKWEPIRGPPMGSQVGSSDDMGEDDYDEYA
jgi:hypothetical protein